MFANVVDINGFLGKQQLMSQKSVLNANHLTGIHQERTKRNHNEKIKVRIWQKKITQAGQKKN